MSKQDLPEELLESVLSFCLTMPLDLFFGDNPASDSMRRYSELLRVSKLWLRVGLPLLYSMIYMNGRHTRTIVSTLRKNPDLQKAVRSLRVDGIHDQAVIDFVSAVPKVENLHINMDMAIYNESFWYGGFAALGPLKSLYICHSGGNTPEGPSPMDTASFCARLYDTAFYHIMVWAVRSDRSSPVSSVTCRA